MFNIFAVLLVELVVSKFLSGNVSSLRMEPTTCTESRNTDHRATERLIYYLIYRELSLQDFTKHYLTGMFFTVVVISMSIVTNYQSRITMKHLLSVEFQEM